MSMKSILSSVGVIATLFGSSAVMAQGDAGPAGVGDLVGLDPSFEVTFSADMGEVDPVSGRLVIYFIDETSGLGKGMKPANGPFWDELQPMCAVDVTDFGSDGRVIVDSDALSFPVPLNQMEEGLYRVQAVLHTAQTGSDWVTEDGNYFSVPWYCYMPGPDGTVNAETLSMISRNVSFPFPLPLERETSSRSYAPLEGYHVFEMKSDLLSSFHGEDVYIRAGVMSPTLYRRSREYPVVMVIPSYGLDYTHGWRMARWRQQMPGHNTNLYRSAYNMVLSVDGPWGHTLLADSATNGPVGEALATEFIPAIQDKYPLIDEPAARVLWGASSGGWAAAWLALNYPDTFGAAWAVCPDPVDFRAFQGVNIYDAENMYVDASGADIPAYRDGRRVKMTNRDENLIEEIIGTGGTSGMQWDSWNAVFSPRGDDGRPLPLFDWKTGEIDRDVADAWTAYDISRMVAEDPDQYAPIFRNRIRLIVGEKDNYYLEAPVKLLKARLEMAGAPMIDEAATDVGSVRILADDDHFTLQDWRWKAEIGAEIYEYLKAAGVRDRKIETADDAGQ